MQNTHAQTDSIEISDIDHYLELIHTATNQPEFDVLETFTEVEESTHSELSEQLDVADSTLSDTLSKLANVGLVRSRKSTDEEVDGRFTFYTVTPLGELAVQSVYDMALREQELMGEHPGLESGDSYENALENLSPQAEKALKTAQSVGIWGSENIPTQDEGTSVKLVGCGGAGSRIISWIETLGLDRTETIAIDADRSELEEINADTKILLRPDLDTNEAKSTIEAIRKATEDTQDQLEELLEPSEIVFILTGLGGISGTGITPVVANAATRTNATVVSIATLPHRLEKNRRKRAWQYFDKFQQSVDTFAVLDPSKFETYAGEIGVGRILEQINQYIVDAVRQLILRIDDFTLIQWEADFRSFLEDGGVATLLSGTYDPTNPDIDIAERLLSRSLLDIEESDADRAILLMRGGPEVEKEDVHSIVESVATHAEHVAWVYNEDNKLQNEIRVTGIVTGIALNTDELRTESVPASEQEEDESFVLMSSESRLQEAITNAAAEQQHSSLTSD